MSVGPSQQHIAFSLEWTPGAIPEKQISKSKDIMLVPRAGDEMLPIVWVKLSTQQEVTFYWLTSPAEDSLWQRSSYLMSNSNPISAKLMNGWKKCGTCTWRNIMH